MSSGLDGISDDETGNQAIGHIAQYTQQVAEVEVREENDGQPPTEGLNPWSIAKLTGKARTAPLDQGRVQDTHREIQPQLLEINATGPFSVSSPLNTQEPNSGHSPDPEPSRLDRRKSPASHDTRFRDFMGNRQDKLTVRSTRSSPNQHGRSRRYHALRSPSTSSPHDQDREGLVSGDRPRPRNSVGPGRIVQSRLPFDRNNSRPRLRDHLDLDLDLNRQASKPTRPDTRARNRPPSHSGNVEDMDTIMGTFLRVDSAGGDTAQQTPPPPISSSRNASGGDESTTEAQLVGRPDESTTQPLLRIDDPRARFIQQQRLTTANVRKNPKRLKTGQLPLETIPCDSETCALLLTMAADACSLAQLLTEASRFDTWLVDGELRGAFEDGTGPKDTARLVEPLLARLGYGTTAYA